jgi:hypothetical protein
MIMYEHLDSIINTYPLNKMSEEREIKEGPITYSKLLASLKKAKHNKSPGMDGYTVEFYKSLWRDTGHSLLRSINEGCANGSLSTSQNQGIIACIRKPGKPRHTLGRWRQWVTVRSNLCWTRTHYYTQQNACSHID